MDTHAVQSRVGADEEPHEKTSVLKKVKAKARKMRDTITGQGQLGHEPEGHHTPDDQDLDEEDVDDPEVQGAPIYDSAVKKTDAPVQGDVLKVPKVNSGDTRAGHDEHEPVVARERPNVNVSDPTRSNVPGLQGTTGHGAMHNSAATRRTDAPVQGGIHFGETHHEYDPVAPKERSNVGISDPMRDSVPGQNRTTTGQEDLLGGARTKPAAPTTGPVPKHEEPKGLVDVTGGGPQTRVKLGQTDELGEGTPVPQSYPVSSGTQRSAMDVDPKQTFVSGQGGQLGQSRVNPQAYTPSNYETEATDPTKSGGEEIGVTPMLHSFDKMNLQGDARQYLKNGDKQNPSTGSHDQFSPDKPSNQGSSYTEKISYATSAIADKAILAKNVVASKLGYGGNEPDHDDYSKGYVTGAGKSGSSPRNKILDPSTNQFIPSETPQVRGTIKPDHDTTTGAGKSSSSPRNKVLDPSTNQFIPAETPQVRGTIKPDHDTTTDQKPVQTGGCYTEKVSSAGSAIADKAISAKNVVASKLGYGASDQVHDREDVTRTNVQSGTTAADQHGKTITSTVYEKVAGAGTAVMSKFQGGSTVSTGKDTSTGVVNQAGQDKRVSGKDYFVEKLKPGEEDKALSEVISEKLRKPKPAVKQETGYPASARPKGKVTESAEVRQRLGNTEGNENFVVDKIEDTVGSMLGGTGKSDEKRGQGLSRSAATGEEN